MSTPETSYVILEQIVVADVAGGWKELGIVTARSADAAIRTHLGDGKHDTTVVAIPARSWKPVRVRTQTVTRLTFEDA